MPHDQPVIAITTDDNHQFELIHVESQNPHCAMLFLPGMGLTARQYIGFAQALASEGIEMFIHEWRGLGSSSLRASRGLDWGYRELLELDLFAALSAVGKREASQPLLLGGHSLGSQLACLLGACRPSDCDGLVIVAGGAPYWRSFSPLKAWGLRAALHGMPVIASLVGHYPGRQLGFAGRESRSVIADWTRTGRTGVYQPPGVETDLEAALAALAVPVLALRMQADWFVPPESLQWLLNKMPDCESSSVLINSADMDMKADHFNWMQSPEASASAIQRWVNQNIRKNQD
jgi:predicted alpha/beta hydrolase